MGARSTYRTPPPYWSMMVAAICTAMRVFSMPPAPVRATGRSMSGSRRTSTISLRAHEVAEQDWKVLGARGFAGPLGWERAADVRMAALHHPLWSGQITSSWVPRSLATHHRKQVRHRIAGGAREYGLARVRQLPQPSGAVDGWADVVDQAARHQHMREDRAPNLRPGRHFSTRFDRWSSSDNSGSSTHNELRRPG
jgi:hypothetical protein